MPTSGGGIFFSGCDIKGLSAKEEFKKHYLVNADFIFRSGELSGQDFREIQKKWVSVGFQWTDFIDMANQAKNPSETSDQNQAKSSAPEKTAPRAPRSVQGKWLIDEMEVWDQEYVNMEVPGGARACPTPRRTGSMKTPLPAGGADD